MKNKCRVALFGECMIELRGEMFGTMQQTFGGDTLNTAVYLARLGADTGIQVSYATQLGTDAFSAMMVDAWEKEGIDTCMVRRVEGKMPGLYTIQVDETGERTFYYWRDMSAAKDFFLGQQDSLLGQHIDELDVLYYSGISLAVLPDAGRETLFGLIDRLRARGGKVYFDNNYRPRVWRGDPNTKAWYDRAFANADLTLITLEDNAALYGLDEESALAHAYSLPCDEVVVKRGVDPTLIRVRGQEVVMVPTFRVEKVVDTTGAGDSFAGGYLAARLAGQPPEVAGRYGNKLASIVVQYPGAIIPLAAMPVFFFG
ncbi:sugar kinase [Uliginosibacterium flavum]|uniref:Sugar kinase n=1 Tax=Uliginosibacterium flavum TaxID=1396831 RepID=A0ABV2TNW7_9RHOO